MGTKFKLVFCPASDGTLLSVTLSQNDATKATFYES